jgi:hypothetical protein
MSESRSHVANCPNCGIQFSCAKKLTDNAKRRRLAYLLKQHLELDCEKLPETAATNERAFEKNWRIACLNCGERPTVGTTELCGPCCFGEAETVHGNW